MSRGGATGRPIWTVLLAGRARVSAFGEHRWLTPGAMLGVARKGWRDTVNRRRVMLGAAMMTSPDVTVSRVAAAKGFSSPEVFARALADVGLPPPSEIHAEVARLGAEHPAP